MIDTILFDLDGTLLPMDQEEFIHAYFNGLATKGQAMGIEPQTLIQAVWAGTQAMLENDGSKANEIVFWDTFTGLLGAVAKDSQPIFEDFYRHDFHQVQTATQPNADAPKLVRLLKQKGYRLILATNPIFPRIATLARIQWAGLQEDDFDWITTYENASFTKPNLMYYEEILKKNQLTAACCLMVGNDVGEDMGVSALGMHTYLVNDCLIHKNGEDISGIQQGSFQALMEYANSLPDLQLVF